MLCQQGIGDDVAFRITVGSQNVGDRDANGEEASSHHVDIDVCHDAVSEAIQGAVETAVQEVTVACSGCCSDHPYQQHRRLTDCAVVDSYSVAYACDLQKALPTAAIQMQLSHCR